MARILIIEDELMIAMMLADWVTELGHDAVGPACTVAQALQLIEDSVPSAAILDVHLCGERCDPVAERLAAQSIPFAFATGSDAGIIPRQFAAIPKLMKPFDFETARGVVERLCRPTTRGDL